MDNVMWKTKVFCDCQGEILCFLNKVTDRAAYYGYLCRKCKKKGDWYDLARQRDINYKSAYKTRK